MLIHQSIYNATHQSHILGENLGDFYSKCMLYYHMCGYSPTAVFYAVLTELFTTKEISYHLRIKNLLQIPKVKTSSYGQSSLSFRGSILWNTLSDSIKSVQNVKGFKTIIRNLKGESCSCIICK